MKITNPSDKQIIGYFTGWNVEGDTPYRLKDVATHAAERLTVINYAFGNVLPVEGPDGESAIEAVCGDPWVDYQRPFTAEESVDTEPDADDAPLRGNFNQFRKLKAAYPHLKVMISLGGWIWSKCFSDAALTEATREAFVASSIDRFIRGNLPEDKGAGGPGAAADVFDGIDIDWEYPAHPGYAGNIVRPEDTENFTLLLAEFRRQLDAIDPALLLTIAAPAPPRAYRKMALDAIHPFLDWINVMTYDFHEGHEPLTNFHANLYPTSDDPSPHPQAVDTTVRGFLAADVPASKVVVGVPFYGRGWTGVEEKQRGLYQPAQGSVPEGNGDYARLKQLVGQEGYHRYWHTEAEAPWLFDGDTFWAYDDEITLEKKMAYVREHNLGGAMFWSLDGDDENATLVKTIHAGLHTT